MRLYQFYTAAGTGTVQIQMLSRGNIVTVAWALRLSTNIGSSIQTELSYSASSALSTHNPVGVISFASLGINQDTAASNVAGAFNYCHNGLYCPVDLGAIIYLNSVVAGTSVIKCMVHVQEGGR